jgi:hypothetical protein
MHAPTQLLRALFLGPNGREFTTARTLDEIGTDAKPDAPVTPRPATAACKHVPSKLWQLAYFNNEQSRTLCGCELARLTPHPIFDSPPDSLDHLHGAELRGFHE